MLGYRYSLRIAGTLLAAGLVSSPAAADQILVASVTCIAPMSCPETASGSVNWRVLNWMGGLNTPYPGANDLHDVTLDFQYQGGSRTWHWDVLTPVHGPGDFVETEPFDISLVQGMISLTLTATLPRTVFDPVYGSKYQMFVANSPIVSSTITSFPASLSLFMEGQFVQKPVPEPATMTLLGFGLAGAAAAARRRRRRR